MNPYLLGRELLDFKKFPDVLADTKDENGKINVAFVYGSGRFGTAEHTGFITDALLIPEIIVLLLHWGDKYDWLIRSFMDFDIFHSEDLKKYNLFVIGSGKVNFVTCKLLEYFKEELKVRFRHPDDREIISDIHRSKYEVHKIYGLGLEEGRNAGLITLMKNPWADEDGRRRIVILAAGAHPIGTIAVLDWLCNALTEPRLRQNNKLAPDIPAKVIKGITKETPVDSEILRKTKGVAESISPGVTKTETLE